MQVAYVPQKPFVMSGSILQNVLMGRPFDESSLTRAMSAAGMDRDLTTLPAGLETEVGERGTTLRCLPPLPHARWSSCPVQHLAPCVGRCES